MRSTVISSARSCLIGVLAASLFYLPVMRAGEAPLGMIVASDDALLSNASATRGVDVYPGDVLTTQEDGSLRLANGPNQMYLLSSTQATMSRDGSAVRAKMQQGTIEFSGTPGQFEVETSIGVIRGDGDAHSFGQVAMLSPGEIQISAYEGELLVAGADGTTKSLGAGETLEASVDPAGGPTDPGIQGVGRPRKINWRRVKAAAVVLGGAGVASYFIYRESTESCSKINCEK